MSSHLMKDAATGHLLKHATSAHLLKEGPILADCYALYNYVDGDLAGCCGGGYNVPPVWDGRFTSRYDMGDYTEWYGIANTIDNNHVHFLRLTYFHSDYSYAPNRNTSLMDIRCQYAQIWGSTYKAGLPSGVFTRSDGCDTTSTLTVVAC